MAVLFITVFVSFTTRAVLIVDGPFTNENVGAVDTFIAETGKNFNEGKLPNSNPETEAAWVTSHVGTTATYNDKDEDVAFYMTDAEGVIAFQLLSAYDYFVVKNGPAWAIFKNAYKSEWGVIDTSLLNTTFNLGSEPSVSALSSFSALTVTAPSGLISHVTGFSAFTIASPTPFSLLLLPLLIFYVRRK